ncbi:MAG: Mov34/MPN/PAD-1 family protein [Candidatus Diapherotrites archaeon]|nr:Mov34/MPN/PAD-1 family protein [Candidatus Diapherotrites archaeon]
MWKIKRNVLESVQLASKRIYPNEFISLLSGDKDKELIDSLIIVPSIFGRDFSSTSFDLVPFNSGMLGSVHSHPSPNNLPSDADLEVFQKTGRVHIIIGYPYNYKSFNLYNYKGEKISFEIVG